ncbi:polyketide synthase [Mycolicibacterium duvalii]|uniref:Mycocerosic acid synthase n=1 Tax=Mycolicibacterium duvalii TaxID=39688 RepID=A0A7I7K639_9MYCO|nr:type I polyketide synthase [Mycolicibacterium duvalii]MCV7366032.1 type I polyketide synthase [Mycolicibacterium duvalii]PEG40160.1 polyketide synthase [Mycolicibacterium duvalii]BBX19477.1 mycocerosic acid synthase [Mycolicibacterium duvalii]
MRTDDSTREPLAIVGIGCRFPGGGDSAERFWELLCDETDATRVVPETRWHAGRYHDPNPGKIGKIVTRRGGFLDEVDQFDPQFFGISPREAHSLDPQQRLLLQTTWEALEDAGMPADRIAGTDVGVFVGGFTLDYQLLQNQGRTSRYRFKSHSATGMMMTMLANRISHAFDFRGPSMTVDTACSSSLVAVHLAAQSIWNGESELALAGGVNLMLGPNTAIAESRSGFLSPEGRSKAFDDAADGYARGEGGAIVVIKPLSRALEDGDVVYAQILGTAVSQDGHTDGITVPREEAQEAAIRTALHRAGVHAADVGYVEAHGTGTPVGDPIELRALARALGSDRPDNDPLLIGSVKTNIGHLEAGAGVAGLIKAALVLDRGFIPANLHLRTPTRHVSLDELNLDIPASGRPFPGRRRRIAGVNSFGFGGTNAHVVLAEPPTPSRSAATGTPRLPVALLPISARSEEALVATAARLADHLAAHPDLALADLGYTLGRRRAHLNHRHTVLADSIAEAREQLQAFVDGGQLAAGRVGSTPGKLAFVCTGMGPQWWRMCRELLATFPVFADSVARSDRELSRYTDWSLLAELRRDEADSRMGDTEIAQPANFAIQVALAEQLAHFGIRPDAVIGHSAGEVAAHYLAGLLTFEQAIEIIYHRSRLQQRTSGQGRMLAVGSDTETLMQMLGEDTRAEFGKRVSVAAVNSPSAVTLAGDGDVLDDIARQLATGGVFHRYLSGAVPYHTHYMDAIKDELVGALAGLTSQPAACALYSTVTGEQLDGYAAGAAYWWQNTRATVLFEPALRRMIDDGYTHFVELGPHPVLAASILETAGSQRVSVVAAQRRDHDDNRMLLNCVGALHCQGYDIGWETLQPGTGARPVKLPTYPWQSKRFWNETQEATEALFYRPVHPLLGQPVSAVHPTWEAELSTALNPFLGGHRVQGSVVVPGSVYLEMAIAAAEEIYGSTHCVDNLTLRRAVLLDDTSDPILRTTLNQDDGTLEFSALTATADGELKWYVTATAELNPLPAAPRRHDDANAAPGGAEPITAIDGDDFYLRTEAIGFDYGDAFRSVQRVTAGEDWAVADLTVPHSIADELGGYRFHPALIDGAFQTLFGAPFLGQEETDDPFLPTRVRHCAVHAPPQQHMKVHARVLSATREEVECDITITDGRGVPLAVIDGFAVQSLSASTRMSAERIDKGLYEVQWREKDATPSPAATDTRSWLVLLDDTGIGSALVDELRGRGDRVHTVRPEPVAALIADEGGYRIDPRSPGQVGELLAAHLHRDGELAGIVNCWPLDLTDGAGHDLGALTVLRLVKALAAHDSATPRIYLVTANAQPVPETPLTNPEQATLWGLGRVLGHQELAEYWGGLVDIDADAEYAATAGCLADHLHDTDGEDQIAVRGDTVYVPRLRPCATLTKPFPTKLAADASYVVTGGAGALGRVVLTYLAERGARNIVLLGRSVLPLRDQWPAVTAGDRHAATVTAIRAAERLGAHVTTAAVDVADADAVRSWRDEHYRAGGRPIRGIIHAAGTVRDQLLVNMSEDDFNAVLAPKITGARALHDTFSDHNLEFFVMFGSAGSTIAAPGQGNYAAANAFLDAFAHHLRAQGRPALTIGWGPWSVGMVEELNLEKMYAHRGIELITPAVGARILDRLIHQQTAGVVAITADWQRARHAGLGGRLPSIFSELDAGDSATGDDGSDASILDVLAATPEADRFTVIAEHVRRIVAGVFDCAVTDIEPDDMLDDIGLDSMMAMDFRVRINTMFSIDLPVLEILRGVSVNSLAERVLTELHSIHEAGTAGPDEPAPAAPDATDDSADAAAAADVDQLLGQLSDAQLRELLAELETQSGEPEPGGTPA